MSEAAPEREPDRWRELVGAALGGVGLGLVGTLLLQGLLFEWVYSGAVHPGLFAPLELLWVTIFWGIWIGLLLMAVQVARERGAWARAGVAAAAFALHAGYVLSSRFGGSRALLEPDRLERALRNLRMNLGSLGFDLLSLSLALGLLAFARSGPNPTRGTQAAACAVGPLLGLLLVAAGPFWDIYLGTAVAEPLFLVWSAGIVLCPLFGLAGVELGERLARRR